MYKLTRTNYIQRLTDDGLTHISHIHAEPEGNINYADYLQWLSEGNTPEPYIEPVPTYQELRASAYPPAADYLDAIVKDDTAQAQVYIDECLAVKAKYPK